MKAICAIVASLVYILGTTVTYAQLAGVAPTKVCPNLSRSLSFGSRGNDVIQLQQFLISQNLLAAGNSTGYFGRLTQSAVQKWQCQHGIACSGTRSTNGYGAVGPRTRAAIARVCASQIVQPPIVGCKVQCSTSCVDANVPAAQMCPGGYSQSHACYSTATCERQTNGQCGWTQAPALTQCLANAHQPICEHAAPPQGCSWQSGATCAEDRLVCASQNTSCTFNGQSISNGGQVTAYQASSVSAGGRCVSETRACANGSLSGSYQYANCSVAAPLSCTLDSVTVESGSSRNFYSAQSVFSPNTCSSIAQSRACDNGSFDGNASYQYASCNVVSAITLTPRTTSVPAGSTLQVSWDTQLATNQKDWIGTVPRGRAYLDYTGSRAGIWFYTDGAKSGTKTLTVPSAPGEYELAYFTNDSYTELARGGLFTATAVPTSLRVMTYNIFNGGTVPGPLSQTAAEIQAAGADIVGIQEIGSSMDALAAYFPGWSYRVFYNSQAGNPVTGTNADLAVLSRYPIVETLTSGVRIQLPSGKDVYIFDAHLHANPYQPYDIRDGSITTESQAISAAQSARGEQLQGLLAEMSTALASGKPVFLTGDFNEPSHLDWTSSAASAGLHAFKVAWPTSLMLVNSGFTDSYRRINASETGKPGNTWTPRYYAANEVHDRIDFVYVAGNNVTTLNSQIVGEDAAHADIAVSPYPSDHRGVVSTFSTTPQ